jgi:(2Fe-2S) ferredoxin
VELDDIEVAIVSDDDGIYAVCGAPVLDRIGIHAELDGATSSHARLMFVEGGVLSGSTYHRMQDLVWYQDLVLAPLERQAATVTGAVTDTAGTPVAGAEVRLLDGAAQASTDEHGHFELRDVPPGFVRLEARQLGYRPVEQEIELSPRSRFDVPAGVFTLEPAPVELENIEVSGTRTAASRRLQGFYSRRDHGAGSYVTLDEYVERFGPPVNPSDLVRSLRGFRVTGSGESLDITATRCTRGALPVVYLDGMYLGTTDFANVDVILAAHHIEGIEAYSAATIPPRFNRNGTACGAIAIWTR